MSKREFEPFETTRLFARNLGLKNSKEWAEQHRLGLIPKNMPRNPSREYKNSGWNGSKDFFTYPKLKINRKKIYPPFEEVRTFARSLNLKSFREWEIYRKSDKKPKNIPGSPHEVYKDKGWNGYGDFLGTGNVANLVKHIKWAPYEEVMAFARSLNLTSSLQWKKAVRESGRIDIPSAPAEIYVEWSSWGYFLGNGNICHRDNFYTGQKNKRVKVKFLPFEDAHEFSLKLNLKIRSNWKIYSYSENKPENIPIRPDIAYRNRGWISWKHWLTGKISLSKEEKKLAKLKAIEERKEILEERKAYLLSVELRKNNKNIKTDFKNILPYEEAIKIIHPLKLKNRNDWGLYKKSGNKPNNIPNDPAVYYKGKGWVNMGNWLGNGVIANHLKIYRPLNETKEFVVAHDIKTCLEWEEYKKNNIIPNDMPRNPDSTYKNKGWVDWCDFFCTGRIPLGKRVYADFVEARKFAIGTGCKTSTEWIKLCKRGDKPNNIPASPQLIYKNKGWLGYPHWFGDDNYKYIVKIKNSDKSIQMLSFIDCREFLSKLGFKRKKDWDNYKNSGLKPENIPDYPEIYYRKK